MKDNEILQTLKYKSVFNYPVSLYQLAYSLQTNSKNPDRTILEQTLKELIQNKKITKKDNKYYLRGTKTYSWSARAKNSATLLKAATPALKAISRLPWVLMIGVTGSVSARNAGKDDDVDILIVTQKDRVWLTRLFVTLILVTLGKYPRKNHKNKVCPNIYISEDDLTWPAENQNLYVANDILQLSPWYYKNNSYFKFMAKNMWITRYFGSFKINTPKRFKTGIKNSKIVDKLETWTMQAQKIYMTPKQTTEVTTKTLIHFNKHDNTKRVLKKLKALK